MNQQTRRAFGFLHCLDLVSLHVGNSLEPDCCVWIPLVPLFQLHWVFDCGCCLPWDSSCRDKWALRSAFGSLHHFDLVSLHVGALVSLVVASGCLGTGPIMAVKWASRSAFSFLHCLDLVSLHARALSGTRLMCLDTVGPTLSVALGL